MTAPGARPLCLLLVAAAAIAVVLAVRGTDAAPNTRSAPSSSTLAATWTDEDGNGVLERGPGERMVARTDLAPRSAPERTLALLAQITDAHMRDEESPARPTVLDRLGGPFSSTFRPQEALTPQTLAQAAAAVRRLRPDAVLETGDLVDNAQENEMRTALSVLRGGRIDPDSGAPGYEGPQSSSNPDPLFYRPAVDAPRHPGLLALAERAFRSPGLAAPWYPVLGNHDALVAGEVPRTPALERLAVGSRAPVRLPEHSGELPRRGIGPRVVDAELKRTLAGRTRRVAPDPGRRLLSPGEAIRRLRAASGHGAGGERLDYGFDVGKHLRVLVLDLVDRRGGSDGVVTGSEVAWLRRALARAGQRYVMVVSHQPLQSSENGELALRVLDRDPRVVAVLAGHTHRNQIRARRRSGPGYWLINTSSLADYPQQTRAIRLVQTRGGVLLETWMVDTASGEAADTARNLAYLDAQGGRPQGFAGRRIDRNALLYR